MKNVIYIAQFHETCGYSHAAHGYLKSIDHALKDADINLKVLSVSLDFKKLNINYHKHKTDKEVLDLIDKFHFKDQGELNTFLDGNYDCIWHMTSIMPTILKKTGSFFKGLHANVEKIILGSQNNYHILAWETDEIPQEYKAAINNYYPSVVFAPSQWNVDTIGKFTKSKLLPHLIEKKSTTTTPVKLPFKINDNFVALAVSEWTNRKNFESLIRSFILELGHKNDAFLVIKTSLPPGFSKDNFIKEFSYIKDSTRNYNGKNQNIVVILDYLSQSKMNFLYQNSTIFCSTSFGEGFSLPTSEAVISNLPVLCPRLGGHTDYLSQDNRYFVSGVWDTVFDNPPYDSDGQWYKPTISSVREKLSIAYSDWKQKNNQLSKSANANYEVATSGNFSENNIGKSLASTLAESTHRNNKTSYIKRSLQNKSLEEQMSFLQNLYKGEDCYILSCGPSLVDYDKEKLSKFLKNKLVFSVKQAYDLFSSVTDFHFFNCSNLPKRENPFAPPYQHSNSISVSSSNYKEYERWSALQVSDVFFKIPIRTEINNEFLVRTGEIDNYLIKNNLTRPCGPGIMYETVLFMALHLGVKSITCIGWDLTKDKVNESNYEHFYGSTQNLMNRGDILDWEIKETREFSKVFYEWCKNNHIELNLASDQSSLFEGIPRIKLELDNVG